jgi:hypothetical protein
MITRVAEMGMTCGNLLQIKKQNNEGGAIREAPLPALPRHTHHDYRCFLPDLAEFVA